MNYIRNVPNSIKKFNQNSQSTSNVLFRSESRNIYIFLEVAARLRYRRGTNKNVLLQIFELEKKMKMTWQKMRLSLFEPRLCDLFGVNRNMNKLIYWLIDHRYRLSTHSVPVILCSVYRLCMFIGSLCKTRSLLKTVRFSSELLRENLTPSLI